MMKLILRLAIHAVVKGLGVACLPRMAIANKSNSGIRSDPE